MATLPVSGALSPTQLAVLEQIRSLRAAKPPIAASAPVQPTAPVQPKSVVTATPDRPAAAFSAPNFSAANPPPANRPRGSILNITA